MMEKFSNNVCCSHILYYCMFETFFVISDSDIPMQNCVVILLNKKRYHSNSN